MPKFSIVIPTRERCHLLKYALLSALEQTYDDYEVIVSDNFSSDQTPQVVKELSNNRVRYIRTSKRLNMVDHWEFALTQAKGEWITILTDRNILLPHFLARIGKLIEEKPYEIITWKWAGYYHPGWYDAALSNRLEIPAVTGSVIECDSRTVLEDLFRFREGYELPKMLNSFCHRALIAKVKNNASCFFIEPNPDYAAAIATLVEVERFVFIDDVLVLGGIGKESTGSSLAYDRGGSVKLHQDEFCGKELFIDVPLNSALITNSIAQNMVAAKKAMPDKFSEYEVNWKEYFIACYRELMVFDSNGIDISSDEEQFIKVLFQKKISIVLPVMIYYIYRNLKKRIAPMISRSHILQSMRLKKHNRRMVKIGMKVVEGENAGFSNIIECKRYLCNYLENNQKSMGH